MLQYSIVVLLHIIVLQRVRQKFIVNNGIVIANDMYQLGMSDSR